MEHRGDSDKTNQRSYWNTGVILIKQKHKHTLTSNIKKKVQTLHIVQQKTLKRVIILIYNPSHKVLIHKAIMKSKYIPKIIWEPVDLYDTIVPYFILITWYIIIYILFTCSYE